MSKKSVGASLDFQFKSKLLRALLDPVELSTVSVNPSGGLVYDSQGASPTLRAYVNDGAAWRKLLQENDISIDADFANDGDSIATRTAIKNYVESLLGTVGGFKGGWDASGGLVPIGTTPGDVKAGDYYRITVAGTLTGLLSGDEEVQVGDIIVANTDDPAGAGDYFALQANFTDANDFVVGPTFAPVDGTITDTTTVHEALEILSFKVTAASDFTSKAGDGIAYTSDRYNVDLAVNSGLELTATDGTGKLRIKGLQDYSNLTTFDNNLSIIGYDDNGNIVVDGNAINGAVGANLAGNGLTWNAAEGVIDVGDNDLQENIELISNTNGEFLYRTRNANVTPNLVSNLLIRSDRGYISGGDGDLSAGVAVTKNVASLSAGHSIASENVSISAKTGIIGVSSGIFIEGSVYNLPSSGNLSNLSIDKDGRITIGDATGAAVKVTHEFTGNGSDSTYQFTHNKGSRDLAFGKRVVAHGDTDFVETEGDFGIRYIDDNTVEFYFDYDVPNTEKYRVTIL